MKEEIYLDLRQVFTKYIDDIKPLINEIESRYNKFPDHVLIEVRDFNDYISQCFMSDINENEINSCIKAATKAGSKMLYHCYFELINYYKREIRLFQEDTRNINLKVVNNGLFYKEFDKLLEKAKLECKLAIQKYKGKNVDFVEILKNAEVAYKTHKELHLLIRNNYTNIEWARTSFSKKGLLITGLMAVASVVIAVLISRRSDVAQVFSLIKF